MKKIFILLGVLIVTFNLANATSSDNLFTQTNKDFDKSPNTVIALEVIFTVVCCISIGASIGCIAQFYNDRRVFDIKSKHIE